MCGWLITSDSKPLHDPADLIAGLRRQPLLAVLRPSSPLQARTQLQLLQGAGLSHVELAVQASAAWVAMVEELRLAFPLLRLGAASVRDARQLQAVQAAGLRYAVSPILVPSLLEQARSAEVTLVPGVFSPTEIAQAVDLGAPAVKLFPAATLGPGYWASLSGPLGPLPFCLAAGGSHRRMCRDGSRLEWMPWRSATACSAWRRWVRRARRRHVSTRISSRCWHSSAAARSASSCQPEIAVLLLR